MSVDIKDHRRHLHAVAENAAKQEAEAPPQHLLQQVEIAQETGDPRLDKMLRAIAHIIEEKDKHALALATQIAALVPVDALKLKQMEFAFTQGIIVACKEIAKIPAQILIEERGPNK